MTAPTRKERRAARSAHKTREVTRGRVIVRGSTYENRANLPDSFFDQLAQYEGTAIGRQELEGELIDLEESGVITLHRSGRIEVKGYHTSKLHDTADLNKPQR